MTRLWSSGSATGLGSWSWETPVLHRGPSLASPGGMGRPRGHPTPVQELPGQSTHPHGTFLRLRMGLGRWPCTLDGIVLFGWELVPHLRCPPSRTNFGKPRIWTVRVPGPRLREHLLLRACPSVVPSLTQVPEEKSPPSTWAPWGAGKVPEEEAALAACPPSPIASTDNPLSLLTRGFSASHCCWVLARAGNSYPLLQLLIRFLHPLTILPNPKAWRTCSCISSSAAKEPDTTWSQTPDSLGCCLAERPGQVGCPYALPLETWALGFFPAGLT